MRPERRDELMSLSLQIVREVKESQLSLLDRLQCEFIYSFIARRVANEEEATFVMSLMKLTLSDGRVVRLDEYMKEAGVT